MRTTLLALALCSVGFGQLLPPSLAAPSFPVTLTDHTGLVTFTGVMFETYITPTLHPFLMGTFTDVCDPVEIPCTACIFYDGGAYWRFQIGQNTLWIGFTTDGPLHGLYGPTNLSSPPITLQ